MDTDAGGAGRGWAPIDLDPIHLCLSVFICVKESGFPSRNVDVRLRFFFDTDEHRWTQMNIIEIYSLSVFVSVSKPLPPIAVGYEWARIDLDPIHLCLSVFICVKKQPDADGAQWEAEFFGTDEYYGDLFFIRVHSYLKSRLLRSPSFAGVRNPTGTVR